MRKRWLPGVVLFIAGVSISVAAEPLDCPMRDAPFSVDGPLIDLLLSETGRAVVDRHTSGGVAKIRPFLANTQAPSFGSIITFRTLAGIEGDALAADLGKLDAELRALPVTQADREARCARYDDDRPKFTLPEGSPRVLLFEKMTGFRDGPSVEAAHAAFAAMAARNGWALVTTDRGGVMHPSVLGQFDVVIWNNVSGDVLTLPQRRAFRNFIESGGGFVGVHGSAGDPHYFWDWYVDTLVGARFIGHPSEPQFQDARISVEGNATGIGSGLAPTWTMNDEWYSFGKSPRLGGATIVATLDEGSYSPGRGPFGGPSMAMGPDHPIAWAKCVGKGRSFYSAIGHRPETWAVADHAKLVEQAVAWAAGSEPCSRTLRD